MSDTSPHIGTLREKPLHSSIKRWYSQPGDQIEVPMDGFVIDLVRDGLLIEVQTRSFSSMKHKLATLLATGQRVRIVHPIAVDRWIVKVDADGGVISRRRSPKHGHPTHVFSELVSFPDLFAHPGLEVEVLLTTEEEERSHAPDGPWRRKGWGVVERRLLEVVDSVLFSEVDDLIGLLPGGLPEIFTTSDLAARLGQPRRVAQQMAYCLRGCGAITIVGKVGNAIEYQISTE